ncbi:cadherin repeat domain-containing protein, partial [Winogradskyella sp.]|uniref:cadherin repeat domain-containing protein n=1 Tax=Winogradskyella sp. TaxID=1883156 RepID=UPI001B0D867B
MNDSLGDGWNGFTLDVYLNNDEAALLDATFDDGFQETLTFTVNEGDDISTFVSSTGSFDFEVSYRILNAVGEEVGAGDAENDILEGSITAACPSCEQTTIVSTEVMDDCPNGEFDVILEIDIEIDLNDIFLDAAGTMPAPLASEDGDFRTYGPFTAGTAVELYAIHDDSECDFLIGTFESIDCPTIVDCDSQVDAGFCYDNNETFDLTFTASDSSQELTIDFTQGTLEESTSTGNTFDDLIIYDGTDATGTILYNSDDGVIGNNDLTGLSFTAPSGSLFLLFDSDFSVSCASGDQIEIEYTVTCEAPPACVPPTIDSAVVSEDFCDPDDGSGSFNVIVEVSDLGNSSPMFDDGTLQTAVALGTNVLGPYDSGTSVTINIDAADDDCDSSLGEFTFTCPQPAPANDLFADAIAVACNDTVLGTTINATLDEADAPDGADTPADPDSPWVWYSFTGTTAGETVTLSTCNAGSDFDTEIFVYTGTSGALTSVDEGYDECGSPDFFAETSFESDGSTTYYIAIGGWNAGDVGNFELSITCEAPVNTPPTILGDQTITVSVEENTTDVTDVDAVDAEDDLAGIDLTYSISTTDGVDGALFNIDATTGEVSFINPPDFENPMDFGGNNGYNLRVIVTDSGGLEDFQNITVLVTDVDETPTPDNDLFADAIAVACDDTVLGTTIGATLDEADAPDSPDTPADPDSPWVWYSFTGTTAGEIVTLST